MARAIEAEQAPLRLRIAKARQALGAPRSAAILAGLKKSPGNKLGPSLKTLCIALEAALPASARLAPAKAPQCNAPIHSRLPSAAQISDAARLLLPSAPARSSILELAPRSEHYHDTKGTISNCPYHAAALIRFYAAECSDVADRTAFGERFKFQVYVKEFADLGIIAAIRAAEPLTKLDLRIFEARAAEVTPVRREFIRHSRHV